MRQRKISHRVYLIVGILVCVLMAIQLVLYRTTVETMEYQQAQTASSAMSKLNSSLGSKILMLSSVTQQVVKEGSVSSLLADPDTNWYSARHKLDATLKKYTGILGEAMYLAVFTEAESHYISTELTAQEKDALLRAYESYSNSDQYQFSNVYDFLTVESNHYNEIYAVCFLPIKHWNVTSNSRVGTAVMCYKVNPKALLISEQALQNTRITLLHASDHKALLLLDNDAASAGADPITTLSLPISHMDTEWKISCVIYPNTSMQSLSTMRTTILLDILVIFLMVICLVLEFKRSISLPLKKLIGYMETYHFDGDQTPLEIRNGAEFSIIAAQVNDMLAKNKVTSQHLLDLQSELYESSLEKITLELQALQRQINPHFLYNTLECMHSLAVIHHIPEIEQMACHLSDLMRYATRGSLIVPLEEEILALMDYIEIMKIRFPGMYTFFFHLPPQLMGISVPKLTLQPIFENIVKYANTETRKQLTITTSADTVDEKLRIVIRYNGKGMPPEQVEQINRCLSAQQTPENHVGLYNVARRIRLHCGSGCGLSVTSQQGQFTEITLLFSMQKRSI